MEIDVSAGRLPITAEIRPELSGIAFEPLEDVGGRSGV
jgi:hypothetical protein